jgi:hypothetical protein
MKIYDVDKCWPEVKRHLSDPTVQLALDLGMKVYAENMPTIPGPWDLVKAPWMYSEDDAWDYIAYQRFETSDAYKEWLRWSEEQEPKYLSELELERWYDSEVAQFILVRYKELMAEFYPQPETPDWYRCIGASDSLGAFNCALGLKVAPHLNWKVVAGQRHTTAIGYDEGQSVLCFDILWCRKTAAEMMKGTRPILWRVPLGHELANLQFVLGGGAI